MRVRMENAIIKLLTMASRIKRNGYSCVAVSASKIPNRLDDFKTELVPFISHAGVKWHFHARLHGSSLFKMGSWSSHGMPSLGDRYYSVLHIWHNRRISSAIYSIASDITKYIYRSYIILTPDRIDTHTHTHITKSREKNEKALKKDAERKGPHEQP